MTKVMLVEDDKSLREIYGVRLAAEGYQIISAGDGEEALAMAVKEKPDLIISDVMMPKISGFDMLDILRATPETKSMKVIMMTALSSEDQRTRGESLGADKYLVKSQVGIEDVIRSVHEVLGDATFTENSTPDFGALAPELTTTSQPTTEPMPTAPSTQPVSQPAPEVMAQPMMPQPAMPAQTDATVSQPIQQPAPLTPETFAPANIPTTPEAATDIVEETFTAQQPVSSPNPQPVQAEAPFQAAASSSMPEPTAPFSTPAPASLGERVVNPISPDDQKMDIAAMMSKELGDDTTMPTPPTV